jgi:hypothetical protein
VVSEKTMKLKENRIQNRCRSFLTRALALNSSILAFNLVFGMIIIFFLQLYAKFLIIPNQNKSKTSTMAGLATYQQRGA